MLKDFVCTQDSTFQSTCNQYIHLVQTLRYVLPDIVIRTEIEEEESSDGEG
jgi:hypothetical protein